MTAAGQVHGLHHIGYWVDDLDRAMADAQAMLGVGAFRVLDHVDLGEFRFRGEPAMLDHTAAFTAWGPVLLELNLVHEIWPADLRTALGVKPGAVSHVSWTTPDLAQETDRLAAAGCPLLTTGVGGAVAYWYSGGPLFDHAIEVHQPTPGVLGMWASLLD